jgi:hypothetical protein
VKTTKYKTTYLNAEDVKEPVTITITDVIPEKVGSDEKLVMYSTELEQPIALNKTCLMQLEEILQSDDTDDWVGHRVVVFNDRSVMFQGSRTGGIRFKTPKDGTGKGTFSKTESANA